MTHRLNNRELLAYSMPALPLAVLGLPLHVYVPQYYAEELGLGFAVVGLVLLAALPVALVLIGYVWVNLELLRCGYRIHELEGRLQEQRRALAQEQLRQGIISSGFTTTAETRASGGGGRMGPRESRTVINNRYKASASGPPRSMWWSRTSR